MPRAEISDPQGQTVEQAMPQLGFEAISAIRVGKRITCIIEAPDERSARATLSEACEKVLANPVIEDYEMELTPVE